MFKHFIFFIVMLLTTTAGADETIDVQLLEIEDADTLIIDYQSQPLRLQLASIDAPEDGVNPKLQVDMKKTGLSQEKLIAFGQLSTQFLKSLLEPGKTIRVSADMSKTDRYGRTTALVYDTANTPINLTLVEQGYAITLKSENPQDDVAEIFTAAQQQALAQKKGLWKDDPETMSAWSGITQ